MRILLILFFLLANTLVSFAQSGMKGRVVEADGTPVIYAAVMLESDKKMVAGGMTGEDGSFLLSGQYSGKYLLKISAIGYKDLKRELECSGKGVTDLGDIVLALDATVLNEALVVAGETAKSVSVEKTRINTASSVAATGSVLDIDHNIRFAPVWWLTLELASNTFYAASRGSFKGADIRNQGWTNNSNAGLTIRPFVGTEIQAQYFVTTPQYFPQFTTRTIHYGNIGVKQHFLKNSLTVSVLLTDVFNARRWDVYSDNPVFTLVNNSKNCSRLLWLGVSWNFHSFKPDKGRPKQQEEDRSVIRIGD